MPLRIRLLSVTPPLVSLFFFSAFGIAGLNVTANCTLSSYSWTFNSIGQSPCTVAAYMLATCYSGSYTLAPLPSGYAYGGPYPDYSNKCECSTVGYSLTSACVACQGQDPFYWSSYVANCTSTSILPPSQFPNPVPNGVHVPHWALLDVTNENDWDSDKACQAGDGPEYGPGAIFGPSGVYTSGATTSSASASSTPSSKSSHSGGHAGAIASGVIGGIAIISIAGAAIFYLQRRRSQAASAGADDSASQPMLSDGAVAHPSSESPQTMRFYDPNDPTTFPGYQGGSRPPDLPSASEVPLSSHIGSGGTPADMQSPPHNRGYHGLPMPSA